MRKLIPITILLCSSAVSQTVTLQNHANSYLAAFTGSCQNNPCTFPSNIALPEGSQGNFTVHAAGDLVLFYVWCYQSCTIANLSIASSPALSIGNGITGPTSNTWPGAATYGQLHTYYILSAPSQIVGNNNLLLSVSGGTPGTGNSNVQYQVAYLDFSVSTGFHFVFHTSTTAITGTSNGSGVVNSSDGAPSITGVTGDVISFFEMPGGHTQSINAPWPTITWPPDNFQGLTNSIGGVGYLTSAASGTNTANFTLETPNDTWTGSMVAFTPAANSGCPSGANYLNPNTNTLTTLASLGVTTCYFVSAAGVDTNNGTSESTPWLHAPQMPGCSGTCLTVQNAKIPAGTGIIMRGGDTWHFGASTSTPYTGGTWNFNASPFPMGTSANPIYIGVDQTWFSGASWVRPVLTADNPVCNASNAGTGGCNSGTTSCAPLSNNCPGQFYVNSCAHQIAGDGNDMFDFTGGEYYMLDNLEMTGICLSETITGGGQEPQGNDTYVRYGSICNQGNCSGTNPTFVVQNSYIHGWSHLKFAGANGGPFCTTGTVCFGVYALQGGVSQSGATGDTITQNVIDGSDSDPIGGAACFGGLYNASYNVIRYTSQCLPHIHTFHDNLYEFFFENGHSNLIESLDNSTTNAIYNNVFRHVEQYLASGGGVFLWPGPQSGSTDYIFNNLAYDVGPLEYFNVGGNGLTSNPGNYVIFNNIWQSNASQFIYGCATSSPIGTVKETNNHYITDFGSQYNGTCSTFTPVTNVLMTNATATTDGYTSSQTFAYSPTSGASPTVGTGTNENASNGAYCSALSTAGLASASTACQADITYACSYAGNGAPPVCPARTSNARPATAAWDKGAYTFSGSNPTANPPTFMIGGGAYPTPVSVTISTTSPGAIICYGTTPATNGSTGCSSGTLFTTPLTINSSEILSAVAGGTGYVDSAVSSATYAITATAATCAETDVQSAYNLTTANNTVSGGTVIIPVCTVRSDIVMTAISGSGTVVTATLNSAPTADYAVGGFVSVYGVSSPIAMNGYYQLNCVSGTGTCSAACPSGNCVEYNNTTSGTGTLVVNSGTPHNGVVGCGATVNQCYSSIFNITVPTNVIGQDPINNSMLVGSGSGVGQTPAGAKTVLIDATNKLNCTDAPMMFVNTSPITGWILRNFSIYGASYDSGGCSGGLKIIGNSQSFRVNNLTFINENASAAIETNGYLWGLVDHTSFNGFRARGCWCQAGSWANGSSADGSWTAASTMGTNQQIVFENDDFSGLNMGLGGVNDVGLEGGGRVTVRASKVTSLGSHGTESGGRVRGMRHYEIYNNSVNNGSQTAGIANFAGFRGGTGMVWGNTVTCNSGSACGNTIYSTAGLYSVYSAGDANPPWGSCGPNDPNAGPPCTSTSTSIKEAADGARLYDSNPGTYWTYSAGTWSSTNTPTNAGTVSFTVSTSPPTLIDTTKDFTKLPAQPGGAVFAVRDVQSCAGGFNQSTCWGGIFRFLGSSTNPLCATDVGANTFECAQVSISGLGQNQNFTSGDAYQILTVNAAIDQVGRGQSTVTFSVPPSAPSPRQFGNKLEPLYSWLNTLNSNSTGAVNLVSLADNTEGGQVGNAITQANRDFYDYNTGWIPGTACTSGVCVGTLANRPPLCTAGSDITGNTTNPPGVGYWATDTSTLYVCTATNTWTLYYQPFTYPHPLDVPIGNPPPAPSFTMFTKNESSSEPKGQSQ